MTPKAQTTCPESHGPSESRPSGLGRAGSWERRLLLWTHSKALRSFCVLCMRSSLPPVRRGCCYVRLTEGTLRLGEAKCLAWETQFRSSVGGTPEPRRFGVGEALAGSDLCPLGPASAGPLCPVLSGPKLPPACLPSPGTSHRPSGFPEAPVTSHRPSGFPEAQSSPPGTCCLWNGVLYSSLVTLVTEAIYLLCHFFFHSCRDRPLCLDAVGPSRLAAASGTPRVEEGVLT